MKILLTTYLMTVVIRWLWKPNHEASGDRLQTASPGICYIIKNGSLKAIALKLIGSPLALPCPLSDLEIRLSKAATSPLKQ